MRARVGVAAPAEQNVATLALRSRGALDRPLSAEAELTVSIARDEALALGAFQRGHGMPAGFGLVRRGSGGPEVRLGPGTVHVELALAHPGLMLHPDPRRIVNRAVRPLLRALSREGLAAAFFGRDWVSVSRRPAAWVGFAHDAATQRTVFEAFVAVSTPFAIADRPSFAGKAHATLEAIAGRNVDAARLAVAITEAYAEGHDAATMVRPETVSAAPAAGDPDDPRTDPPWTATVPEAIGTLGAGLDARGVFRVGGDLLASRDAIAHLEASVAAALSPVSDDEIGRLVDATFDRPEVAIDGVRSLGSLREVIARALPTPARP
jgi:hypothetical protein